MAAQHVVYVDVDDTLVRSFGAKRIPNTAAIAEVKRLKQQCAQLFLWSSGGAAYCKDTATELGLTDCFSGFLPKPTVYVDDVQLTAWRNCVYVHPNQLNTLVLS